MFKHALSFRFYRVPNRFAQNPRLGQGGIGPLGEKFREEGDLPSCENGGMLVVLPAYGAD